MAQRPDDLVTLLLAVNEFQAGIVMDVLTEAGIGAQPLTMMDAEGSGGSGARVPVIVRRDQVAAARAAMDARRTESLGIDWTTIDFR